MFGNPAYECISVLMLQMNAYWFRDTISQLTLQQQSSYNNLNVKQKTLHVSYWFFFSKWDLQIVLSHWDGSAGSRCIKSDACHSDVKKVHVTATTKSAATQGSPRTGVQPWGGQRESHDSLWRGQGLDTAVFNCWVVISQILLGDIVPRVMNKINTQDLIY